MPQGRLARLFAYWQGKRHGDRLPSRGDIRPEEMKPFLPIVYLVDVLGDDQFRYRLLGTEIVDYARRNMTGHILSPATHGPTFEQMRAVYRSACEGKALVFRRRARALDRDDALVRVDGIVLPLSSDGRSVDMLLGGMGFGHEPDFELPAGTQKVEYGWILADTRYGAAAAE